MFEILRKRHPHPLSTTLPRFKTRTRTEAQAAKNGASAVRHGQYRRLTWDIGVIPYQPIPMQWKNADALQAARRDWG